MAPPACLAMFLCVQARAQGDVLDVFGVLDVRREAVARHDDDDPLLRVSPHQIASRRWLWPLSALAILGVGAAAAWTMQPRAAASASAPHLSPAIRVTNTLAEEFGPAISPDGKWLAYYSNTKGRTDLMVKYLDSGATLNLTASQQLELPVRTGIGGVAISPDGTQISFAARIDPQFAGTTHGPFRVRLAAFLANSSPVFRPFSGPLTAVRSPTAFRDRRAEMPWW